MAQFIQIGTVAVNIDLVASVEFASEMEAVYLYPVPIRSDDFPLPIASFKGDDYEVFLSWWKSDKAPVYRR